MKMYVKPSFELEEVLSEDIITNSGAFKVVGDGDIKNSTETDKDGKVIPNVEVGIDQLI